MPPAFANLRTFCEWYADYGSITPCCQRATPEEIAAAPRRYDCTTCPLKAQTDALWLENHEAWQTYQTLCGRTVRDLELAGWLFDRLTAGWPLDETLALLHRLNVILEVLFPKEHL